MDHTQACIFFPHRIFQVTIFIRYGFAVCIQRMNSGIAWIQTEPNGIIKWKRTWHNMYGIGAKWHYIMETDMLYYGRKRSQMALYNGIGYGILWMETEPGMYFFPTGFFRSPHSLGMDLE